MQKHDLCTLLEKLRGSQASDPRDKIYALLGISSDRSALDALQADYEKSELEVVHDTIVFLLGLSDRDVRTLKWPMPLFLEKVYHLGDEVLLWSVKNGEKTTVEKLVRSGKAYRLSPRS